MRDRIISLGLGWLLLGSLMFSATAAWGERFDNNTGPREVQGEVVPSERDEQVALFNYYFWDRDLTYETRLEELAGEASVPDWRIPYSAAIHPQTSGGLSSVAGARTAGLLAARRQGLPRGSAGSSPLVVYDRAFNGGQDLAHAHELHRLMGTSRALLPARRIRTGSESWEGYCSGFTASTIRHPEPIRAVDAGRVGGTPGVVFQPSDIKALLSCIYNRTTPDSYLLLAPPSASDGGPNMGTFHLALGNYIGQAGHPIGIDRTRGRQAWNNPIYAYRVDSLEDAGSHGNYRFKDVRTTITYSGYGNDTTRQTSTERLAVVGNQRQSMTLRYRLALDAEGHIVGGRALSSAGHFLWIPLYPVQATRDGVVRGNPYVDVRRVIDLARASALPEIQEEFDQATIGPRVDPAVDPDQPDS